MSSADTIPELENKSNAALINLLYILFFTLVFEGLLRKLAPSVGVLIFFMKDIICLYGLILILKAKNKKELSPMRSLIVYANIFFIPTFFVTGLYDPAIAIFGYKQYFFYVTVAFMICYAFSAASEKEFITFVFVFTLLLIPTTLIATLQNSLSSEHWLNRSVDGGSLKAFSAKGVLRVSSTFSFTGQYSFYLNIAGAFLGLRIFIIDKNYFGKFLDTLLIFVLAICLMIGAFITGGRTAVMGIGASGVIALGLIAYKQPKLVFKKIWVWALGAFMLFGYVRVQYPQYFKVYDSRQVSNEKSNELENRIIESYSNSTWILDLKFSKMFFGQGVGVMSNGSDKISNYAAEKRSSGFWTENDFQSTLWEGGLYLVIIWYGFRMLMIVFCFYRWRVLKNQKYISGSAFLIGFITVQGITAPLGIQNTIAIWWWFAIGSFVYITLLDKRTT